MAEEKCELTQEDFQKAVSGVCTTFGVKKLYPQQEKALSEFLSGSDVFVSLPMGFGKSLIYQMAPLVANELQHSRFPNESIVVVISPLVALMKDQVSFLKTLNVPAEFVAAEQVESVLKEVEEGKYRLVYTSPESMLSGDRWRQMLTSKVYQKKLIGIAVDEAHCISHWGLSANKGRVAFRQWYSCLKELRSLVPSGLPFLALTATASKTTKKDIYEVLEFKSPCEVVESPDRRNIVYSTQLMEEGRVETDYFLWLISDIKDRRAKTDRVLIYCQSVKQCTQLFQVFSSELKSKIFAGENPNPKERLVEMLHSKTPKPVKDTILESFTKNDGHVRVLFATIAFGMGVNAKGVKTIIHVGPSKNLEAYVQESGRCGRGGEQSRAIVLFNNKMCVFCDKDIKDYVVSEGCRRNILRKLFDAGSDTTSPHELLHNCCDNCAKKCDCDQADCQSDLFLPAGTTSDELLLPRRRDVSASQKANLQAQLKEMRKSLVKKAMQGDQKGRKATVVSCPSFLLEFSDIQIKQVLDNCEVISSISDVMKCVEIWQYKHAEAIYTLFYNIFHDVPPPVLVSESSDGSEDDGDEWPDLLEDDSFQENSGLLGDSYELSGLFANSEDDIQQTNHMYPLELDSVLQNVDMQC